MEVGGHRPPDVFAAAPEHSPNYEAASKIKTPDRRDRFYRSENWCASRSHWGDFGSTSDLPQPSTAAGAGTTSQLLPPAAASSGAPRPSDNVISRT